MKDRKIEGQWRCKIWHVGTGIYKDCARVDRDFGIQIFVYFRRSSFFFRSIWWQRRDRNSDLCFFLSFCARFCVVFVHRSQVGRTTWARCPELNRGCCSHRGFWRTVLYLFHSCCVVCCWSSIWGSTFHCRGCGLPLFLSGWSLPQVAAILEVIFFLSLLNCISLCWSVSRRRESTKVNNLLLVVCVGLLKTKVHHYFFLAGLWFQCPPYWAPYWQIVGLLFRTREST